MLHGSLRSEWYNPLGAYQNEEIKPVKVGYISKGDITWMTPCYYQVHKLINENATTAAISIQSYSHVETVEDHSESFNYILPNDGTLKKFYPTSDYTFENLIDIVMREYRTQTCNNPNHESSKCSFNGILCGSTINKNKIGSREYDINSIYSCDKNLINFQKSCFQRCVQTRPENAECEQGLVAKITSKSNEYLNGDLVLTDVTLGVMITGSISGLKINKDYQLYIHELSEYVTNKDCNQIGGIFNPYGVVDDSITPGYIGKFRSNENGNVTVNKTNHMINTFPGDTFNALNRIIAVHAYEERKSIIGCGQIQKFKQKIEKKSKYRF
jgi:hypothetical protein